MCDPPLTCPSPHQVEGQATLHSYLMRLTHNVLARWTGETLSNVTGPDQCRNDSERVWSQRWLVRQLENGTLSGYCVRSLVAESRAVSPAFEIPGQYSGDGRGRGRYWAGGGSVRQVR